MNLVLGNHGTVTLNNVFRDLERKYRENAASKVKMKSLSRVRLVATPWTRLQPTRLLRPWDFPGKSTVVGCHFLLQGMFLTQGLNPGLPHCRQMLQPLSHRGSLVLEPGPILMLKSVACKVTASCWPSVGLHPRPIGHCILGR